MLYWNSINPKNVPDVFRSPGVTIASLQSDKGGVWLRALMVKWMNSFLKFYSVNGAMDALQVADTINLIIEQYPHYMQEDFKLFFNYAKKGVFGQIYGRIDGNVIFNWLEIYDRHRDSVAQEESIDEKNKLSEKYIPKSTEGVYYHEYLEIKRRADSGDKEAIELLKPPNYESRRK